MNKALQWIKSNGALLGNAASLVGSTGITSALGFIYWWLAARQFSPAVVGLASASISATTLLGTFGILGLGTLLVGELPRHQDQKASLISTALIVVGGVGLGLGLIFSAFAPYISTSFQGLATDAESMVLFALGVSLTSISLVLDQALIGLLQGGLQLWRNALFAVVKLGALFLAGLWLTRATGLAIYTTWTIGNAISLLTLSVIALFKGVRPGRNLLPQFGFLRNLGLQAIKHHALNLTLQAPTMILPVLVTITLSATANAWFYVSWNLSSIGNIVISSLTMVLYAISAAQPQILIRRIRLTLGLAFTACVLINAVFFFGTQQILEFFGHSYAEQAVWSLRLLSLESFLFIIKAHFIAVRRIHGRVAPTALITIATGSLEVGGAALGLYLGGLTGLSLGWLSAMCIETAFMSPTVYRAARFAPKTLQKSREKLFAEDLEKLAIGESAWQVDTLIQPVWLGDTLTLNAIMLPKKALNTDLLSTDERESDIYSGRTVRLANFLWYSEQETLELPVQK